MEQTICRGAKCNGYEQRGFMEQPMNEVATIHVNFSVLSDCVEGI